MMHPGVVEAMKSLSQCYQEGVGCEKDLHLATLWKQKAMVTEPPRRSTVQALETLSATRR